MSEPIRVEMTDGTGEFLPEVYVRNPVATEDLRTLLGLFPEGAVIAEEHVIDGRSEVLIALGTWK